LTVVDNNTGSLVFTIHPINGNTIVNTGFPLSFGFNLIGDPTITYTGLTAGFGVPGDTTAPIQQSAGAFGMDGFGTFEYGVLWGTQGGGAGFAGDLSFTISAAGLDIFDLVELSSNPPGGDQAFAVLDIFSGTTGNTGLVDISVQPTIQQVPLPAMGASLPAFITAAFGFFGWRRMRRAA
jgi:hypothetical protein